MHPLIVDPPIPYLLPAAPAAIILVGCGGTGSHIAQSLARLAVHAADVTLIFIDGDTVEAKNVGRQLFSRADIGKNKAQVLAGRFGLVFGQSITAIPEMATADLLRTVTPRGRPILRLLVGAVDNAAARREIAEATGGSDLGGGHLWIDAGNHEASGQVVVGKATTRAAMTGAVSLTGICTALPAPSLVYPDLLVDQKRRRLDCAAAMIADEQSLMVNQMMAAIVAQYCYQIVVSRRLTTFETMVDLQSLTMRSTPITAATLSRATGVSEERLRMQRNAA